METGFNPFFLLPLVYLVMQVAGPIVMTGWRRIVAIVCGAVMLAAIALAVAGGLNGSNLAPIYVFFALPFLTAILAVLWVAHFVARRRTEPDR